MKLYTIDDYNEDEKKRRKKESLYTVDDFNEEQKESNQKSIADFVDNPNSDKPFTIDDYQKAERSYLNSDFDMAGWFKNASGVISSVQGKSSDDYKFAKKSSDYNAQANSLLSDDKAAESYIESLKGTKQYDTFKNEYNNYKAQLQEVEKFTKSISNFASQYKSEDDYTTALKGVKRAQKYGALKSYADYMNAVDEANNDDDRAWLKAKAEDIATSEDIEKRIEQLRSQRSQGSTKTITHPGYYSYSLPNGQTTDDDSQAREELNKSIAENKEIERLESLVKRKETKEKLNKYYYDLTLDEKNVVKRYNDMNEGDVPTADGSYSGRAMLGGENKEIREAAEKLAKKKGVKLDELSKWYARGEEDDEAQLEQQRRKDRANEYPVATSFESVVENPFKSVATAMQYGAKGIDQIVDGEEGYINPKATPVQSISDTRETVVQGIDNPVGSFLYNTGMSMADFVSLLPLNSIPGGQAVGLAVMSTEAGAQSANDAIERGATFEQGLATGVASGIAEALFEKVSLDQLKVFKEGGKSSLKDIVQNIFKGAFVEGSEEVATDFANALTDNIINKDFSEIETNKQNYIKQGYSKGEADIMSAKDFWLNVGSDFVGGALSGGVINVGTGGINAVNNYMDNVATGEDIKAQGNADELLSVADLYKDNTTVNKLSEKLNAQKENGKEYSSSKLGKLRTGVMTAAAEANANDRIKAAENYIDNSELSGSEKTIAKKFTSGESLSQSDVEILNSSDKLKQVVKTIPEMSDANSANFVEALKSTDIKITKPEVKNYNTVDTRNMEANEALNAVAKANNFNEATTKAFVENYDSRMSVDNYGQQFMNYHNIGRTLSPLDTLDRNAYTISDKVKNAAYETGVNVYAQNARLDKALTDAQQKWKQEPGGYTRGEVDTSEIKDVKLERHQKDVVKYASHLAAFGVNVKFYAAKPNAQGNYTSANGWYDSSTNTLAVDVNSERSNVEEAVKNGAMLSTISHELTHIAENAPEEYTELRKAVSEAIGADEWENAKNRQAENLKNNHPEDYNSMSEAEIEERTSSEAMAELCADMLKDTDLISNMFEENPTAARKFINFVKSIIKRLRDLHKRIVQDSNFTKEEAQILKARANDLQSLVNKWESAVKEGIKNQNAKQAVKSDTEQSGNMQDQERENKSSFNEHTVSTAIWEALDHKDMGHDNLIKAGEMPKYIQSILGITGDFYIQRNHTYENTVTEKQAKDDGRYSSKAHYHGYGVNKMERAMLSIENPIMTISTKTNDGNPTVIMLLDEFGNNNTPLYAVLSFYSNKLINGRNDIKPHVVLTIAEREWYAKNGRTGYNEIIGNAIKEKRVIDFDKKKRGELSEVAQTTSLGSITESSLSKSLSQFKKEINSYKNKNNIQYQDRQIYSNKFKEWFGDWENEPKSASKIVNEDGKPLVVYHGTDTDFTVFDETKGRSGMDIQGMFFSPWEIEAQGYGSNVRAFYLNIKNPAPEALAYKILRKYAKENYAGKKAREELIRMGYDGVQNYDEYIAFYPEQIKSATDNIGTFDNSNPDIRFQDRGVYTYEELAQKPDMKISEINDKIYNRADTVFYAKKNAAKIGERNSKNEVSVYVDDLGGNVILTTEGLRHSLNRKLDIISPVTVNIGKILKQSIVINELIPKNKNASNTYVLIGAARFTNGESIIVRSIVNEFDNSLQSIETLYAVNAKKEPTATESPRFTNNNSLSFIGSTISISDLLDYVNKYYPDILPSDVLNHYGRDSRPNSELSDSVKYQDRGGGITDSDVVEQAVNNSFDFELDDDLFEDGEQEIDFEAMIEEDPSTAVELMYKSIAKQSSEVIRMGKDIKMSDLRYNTIVNKMLRDYSIERSYKSELFNKIKNFIENTTEATFAEDYKNFVLDMRQALLYSTVLDEDRDERRKAVRDTIKGRTLVIPQSAEAEIRSGYESVRNYANRLFGYGITVALRENTRYGANDTTIKDLISDIQEQTGEMVQISEIDGEGAYINLESYLSEALSPQYINPYLDGMQENIDIAAVELASDVMAEYTRQLGLGATSGNSNKRVNQLNNQLETIKAQRDKLLKASRENAKLSKDLSRYKERLDTLEADMDKLNEIDWLIKSNYEDDTLLQQREDLENKVEEGRKALLRLKTTKPIKNAFDRQIKKAVQAEREKQRNIIRENRNKYAEDLNKLKDQNFNRLNEWRQARKKSEVVDNISQLQRKMARALRNPTENVYVPEAFATAYNEACAAITEALNNGKVTQANTKLLSLKNELDKLNNFDTEYNGEISEQLTESLEYVIELTKILGQQIEGLDGRPITKKTISLREANDIYNVLFEIYNTVQDATKQLGREDRKTNYQSGDKIDEDMKSIKKFAEKAKLKGFKSFVLNGIRTARYYSGYNDNSEIMYHVNALNEGVRKANIYKMNAEKKFLELTEKHKKEYQRSLSEVVDVSYNLNNGEEASVKLTRMTALQTLMTWTREQSSRNLVHMERSGIILPDAELISKGKIKEALDKSTRIKTINTSFVIALENTLTDFEQEYRNIAEEYFNHYSKAAINEVSNVIKHRSIAMADYYIPMTVDSNFLVNELEELKFDATIEGMGMLKSTVIRANQPLIMTSLNTVIARHINDTAKLYGLAIPTRNFKKALNVSFTDLNENGETIKSGSVRDTIKSIWGEDANKFFNRLIADLESPRNNNKNNVTDTLNKVIVGLRKAMVVKTLTANLSVVIKQAASYPTAGVYLSHSALAKGLAEAPLLMKPGNYQALIDEIDEHTAQHYMRRIGLSQEELSEFINSWAGKVSDKLPTAVNPVKWIQGVDCITTALLWNATKAEINKTGIKSNDADYWNKVTELYDKVIEDTQPMYDTLHRAEAQKNTSELWKSVFMFKTQPLQNTGVLYDSIGNALAHPKSSTAKRTVIKALSSQLISLTVFAGMSLAAAAVLNRLKRYKDDDGEITTQSIMSTVFNDMLVNGTGVLMPLFGNEAYELIKSTVTKNGRYDTFSMPNIDMLNDTVSAIQDAHDLIINDINKAQEGVPLNSEKIFQTIKNTVIEASGLAGVPTQNFLNIINAFTSRIGINALAQTDNRKASDDIKSYGDNYTKGNTEKAKSFLDKLYNQERENQIAKGKDTSDAHKEAFSSVRKKLSGVYKLEYQKAHLRGDDTRKQEIKALLYNSGYMVYTNKSLYDVISGWEATAQSDVANSYNKN